jgi:chemotaxis protein CheD
VFDGSAPSSGTVYVAPGQVVVTTEPLRLKTVLGSCVSVTLFDASARVGGLNHFLLPGTAPDESPERYGQGALDALLGRLERHGSTLKNLQAGVFGGACVLRELSELMHLGERNVEFAFLWLHRKRIEVATRDVLGQYARRLEFSVADGSTHVRLLGGS